MADFVASIDQGTTSTRCMIFDHSGSEVGRHQLEHEQILPKAILRTLSVEEMAEYRRPFADPGEGRRPTLTWPRQIPIEGEPADVVAIAAAYADWLATSSVPKLFVKAEPGGILTGGAVLDFARRLPAQTEVTVAGVHYLQEDSPDEIGRAIAGWMATLG